jgi:hypothetical protein
LKPHLPEISTFREDLSGTGICYAGKRGVAAGLVPHRPCVTARLLDDEHPYGLELFSQPVRVHPRGVTYRLKVLVVVKKEFFRKTAITQWAAYPLFEGLCDDGSPKPFLGGSIIAILEN